MKKYIITLAIALGFGMNVNAQIGEYKNGQTDGFFAGSSYNEYREDAWAQNMPLLPGQHGTKFDFAAEPAPLGSGLLLLAGMAVLYASRKKSN